MPATIKRGRTDIFDRRNLLVGLGEREMAGGFIGEWRSHRGTWKSKVASIAQNHTTNLKA